MKRTAECIFMHLLVAARKVCRRYLPSVFFFFFFFFCFLCVRSRSLQLRKLILEARKSPSGLRNAGEKEAREGALYFNLCDASDNIFKLRLLLRIFLLPFAPWQNICTSENDFSTQTFQSYLHLLP